MEWYLIQEGSVTQKFGFTEITLERNAMVGILESEWFICDYIAKEDTTLIVIPCKNSEDLQTLLSEHENFRAVFLRAAIEQKYKTFVLYQNLSQKVGNLHSFAEHAYHAYLDLCHDLLLEAEPFPRMDEFGPISMQHKADAWEISNCNSLVKKYLKEYMILMIKDDAMCVGAIMEAAAQMRRVTQGINEMVEYLEINKDILWAESENDIYHLYFDLAVQLSKNRQDIEPIRERIAEGFAFMEKLGIYSAGQLTACKKTFENYDFSDVPEGRINITRTDCVAHIMEYAKYSKEEIANMKNLLASYRALPDMQSTDTETHRLRKEINTVFYEIYEKAFLQSVKMQAKLSPILVMFFNFGFMDVELLGAELTNSLYNLTDHLAVFRAQNIYPIYDWLLAIYKGEKEPSRNEFDMNYKQNLVERRRLGEITEEQMKALENNQVEKVCFEIRNMFRSAHRMTYGRITTFCPILGADDFINSVEKMALTATKLTEAINRIRELDYSVLYREVMFTDPEKGVSSEWIQKEVLPDMILMPDAGTKGVMWQETSGPKTDSPARFIFPIFTAIDLDEQMVEIVGRYRWEICRRIQGVYWNDIREKSLTSEYYDYIQFYKKNSELSTEAKEKIKLALSRARNNYREVFVKDYQNWLKYESQGSYRLNKVARNVFLQYCPFNKEVRKKLKANPVYQNAFHKQEIEQQTKLKRFLTFLDKYEAAGGEVTPLLNNNLQFYQM